MGESKVRMCPQDCRKCSFQQQTFCTAQLSFNAFSIIQEISNKIEEVNKRLNILQNSIGVVDELAYPMEESVKRETAQIIDSQDNKE